MIMQVINNAERRIRLQAESKVNHPKHYNAGKFEVIDVIEDWDLNFHLGNAVKYIARCEHKDNKVEDLEKAIFYLNREIENSKKESVVNE